MDLNDNYTKLSIVNNKNLAKVIKENNELKKQIESLKNIKENNKPPEISDGEINNNHIKKISLETVAVENKKLKIELSEMKSEIKDLKIQVKNLVEILETILKIKN